LTEANIKGFDDLRFENGVDRVNIMLTADGKVENVIFRRQ
jgi:hypothetical protein